MKKLVALLLIFALCPLWTALAEEPPTCWINKPLSPYGSTWAEVQASLGDPFWDMDGYDRISAWETDRGTFIAEFRHPNDTLTRYLHIAPDRTILEGTVSEDDTLYAMRYTLNLAANSTSTEQLGIVLTDVGHNYAVPAAITAEGYVISCYHGSEWEVYDCVKQRPAGLLTQLRVWLGW